MRPIRLFYFNGQGDRVTHYYNSTMEVTLKNKKSLLPSVNENDLGLGLYGFGK